MNEIIHKFLLSGYIFMPEMHLKQPGFTYHLLKTKKVYKNLTKQDTQNIFTKMNLIKLIWLMELLKIYQKEQLQIKF